MGPNGIMRAVAEAEGLAELRRRGSVKVAALDWRRDWHGPGEHGYALALTAYPFGYSRDAAMFGPRELLGLAGERDLRYGANADRFTAAVYRHPEYRAAIRDHDPRTVFDGPAGPPAHVRDISDMVDADDGYRPQWIPCERCAGRYRDTREHDARGPVLECENCGRRTVVVDAL